MQYLCEPCWYPKNVNYVTIFMSNANNVATFIKKSWSALNKKKLNVKWCCMLIVILHTTYDYKTCAPNKITNWDGLKLCTKHKAR